MYILCALFLSSALALNLNKNFETNIGMYDSSAGREWISLLQESYLNGDTDAGGHLSFAWALGAGVDQNLKEASTHSHALVSAGAARAHTTLGLLLHHNLTDGHLSKKEREQKALGNYAVAAVKGDPLAQIIISEHYAKRNDCSSAISYYRKAASVALSSTLEMEISRPSFVQYVVEEDSPVPPEIFPTQDKLQFYEHLASHGNAEAAMQAATFYLGGAPGLKRNIPKATELLRIAIKANNSQAMVWMGTLYLRGMTDIRGEEAYELLQTALNNGDGLAYSGIGRFHAEGQGGIKKNVTKAEEFFKKGMQAGNIDAFYQLGLLYEAQGYDSSRSAELWYLPAIIGHVHSSWHLAEYYRKKYQSSTSLVIMDTSSSNTDNFKGVNAHICEAAIPFYRLVALTGSWKDLFDDAYEDYHSNKKGAALLKYLLLSDLGYSAGHINAARILDEGGADVYNSTEAVIERALESWTRAAEAGVAKAYVKLGDFYYYGRGKPKDLESAAMNYQRAASMEDAEGGFNLALVTEWGEGVPQNISRARQILQDLYTKHEEAQIPVILTLGRLETFAFLKNTFSLDLYKVNTTNLTLEKTLKYFDVMMPHWDTILIIMLICFIIINYLYMI